MDRSQIKEDLDEILRLTTSSEGMDDSKLQTYKDAVEVFMDPSAPSFYVILAEQELRQSLNLQGGETREIKKEVKGEKKAPEEKLTSAALTQVFLDEIKRNCELNDEYLPPVVEKSSKVMSKYDEYLPHKLDYASIKEDINVEPTREKFTSEELTQVFLDEKSRQKDEPSADLTQVFLDEKSHKLESSRHEIDYLNEYLPPVMEIFNKVLPKYDEYLPHKLDYALIKKDENQELENVEPVFERFTSEELTQVFLDEASPKKESEVDDTTREKLTSEKLSQVFLDENSQNQSESRKIYTSAELTQVFLDEIAEELKKEYRRVPDNKKNAGKKFTSAELSQMFIDETYQCKCKCGKISFKNVKTEPTQSEELNEISLDEHQPENDEYREHKNIFIEFRKKRYTSGDLTQVWLDEVEKTKQEHEDDTSKEEAHSNEIKFVKSIPASVNLNIKAEDDDSSETLTSFIENINIEEYLPVDITSSVVKPKTKLKFAEPSAELFECDEQVPVDITASVLPELQVPSTISFEHKVFDENATFSMQPDLKEKNLLNCCIPYVFGQWKPKFDCNCMVKVEQRIQEFESILKKAADVIERIERENLAKYQQICESESIANTVKEIESNLEIELQRSVESLSSNITSFSKFVIKSVKSVSMVAKEEELPHVCQCQLKMAARIKSGESKLTDLEDNEEIQKKIESDASFIKLPVTLMINKIFFGKHPREQLKQIQEKLRSDVKDDKNDESKTVFEKIPENLIFVDAKVLKPDLLQTSKAVEDIYKTPDVLLKNSHIRQKITQFESLSAKSSLENATVMPNKTYSHLTIMNLMVDQEAGGSIKNPKTNIESNFVMKPHDIEDLPPNITPSSSRKSILKSPSKEEAEMSSLYKKVLLLGDEKYISKSEAIMEQLNDDDGFANLPKIDSNTLSKVASSEWMDENITFNAIDDENASERIERVSLSTKYFDEPESSVCFQGHISPTTSEASSHRMSRLRQCKCFMKRLSKSFIGKK